MPENQQSSRRSILTAGAWAAPVVAAAAMTPAAAASRVVPCTPTQIPQANGTGTTGWVTTLGSNPNAAPSAWTSSATPSPNVGTPFFRAYTDSAAVASGATLVTSTVQMSVVANTQYTIQFNVQAGKGYVAAGGGATCTTINSTAIFDIGTGTTRQVLFRGHTQTAADTNPSIFMNPPASCTVGGARANAPGYAGVAGAVYTTTVTYTAPSTGTVELRMRFNMVVGTNSGNNDDWYVKPTLVACRRSGA
ncbi:hypothetical protein C5B85_06875 [Pseudoclavibacter sp. AY1F1]|uniref:hypothetical protein n=1 Tax=Pseudoclavibacter sp. AY1F1 TaxID=2080583 RepID=UPI000CE80B35|nr:hypothetical protein [Pseudoclavibacter sp. AY1F1]PPF45304.1 hypothetical protein C5B85_06875 [Pseudoclavibacter sp. AY1F1]